MKQREQLEIIRQLLDLFRLERAVYLCITVISLVTLIVCAMILLFKRQAETPEIIALFSSTGGIMYSTGRVLRMWSDAIKLLRANINEEGEHE